MLLNGNHIQLNYFSGITAVNQCCYHLLKLKLLKAFSLDEIKLKKKKVYLLKLKNEIKKAKYKKAQTSK